MAIVREGQAPYPPTATVMAVIEGYRSKHPQTPFTVDSIQPLGVSESLAPRTLQALRLLDLVDDDGEPTAAMNGLREASRDEFPERLAAVVRAAYHEVFSYKDPATDSPEELADVFRFYRPHSMKPRMLRLFYGLCAEAGIIESAPAITASGQSGSRQPPGQRAKRDTAGKGSKGSQKPPPPPPPPPPPAKTFDGLKARYVELLLDKLQSSTDGGFDAELADRIERLMGFEKATTED